ncbi:MAG: hypothetical protein WAV05_09585 [Anaerolineales bacterium]
MRWVAANALGEMFGLGLTFGVGTVILTSLGGQQSVQIMLASFLVVVVSGVFEATLVSLARWWALHPWFPIIARASWWRATLVGAIQGPSCYGWQSL